MMEILVAMIILALTVGGLVSVFVSAKRWLLHSRAKMSSGELGKYFLDPLQAKYVRQDTWSTTNPFGNSAVDIPAETQELDRRSFTATYAVDRDNPVTGVIKVTATITWDEPSS